MANSRSSGCQYALSAIGIGMLVLGIIIAVWNLAPGIGSNDKNPSSQGNSSEPEPKDKIPAKSKTFSIAYVLVGSGIVLLLLAICLTIRKKKKQQNEDALGGPREIAAIPPDREEDQEDENALRYAIPSYEDVMGPEFSADEGTAFDRNARISMSLPSYESLNELDENTPTTISPKDGSSNEHQQDKLNSRNEKEKKPLKVRRIKSDKLHLKDFRLNLSSRAEVVQTIVPLTPPPVYEGKTIENTPSEQAT